MARRLSKKKISCWLLLIAVIIFFQCGCHHKVASAVGNIFSTKEAKTADPVKVSKSPEDFIVDANLTHRLDSFVTHAWRNGTLSVYVQDETAGKEVYDYKPDTLMRPASNMKMLTCITALRRLGPNYKLVSGSYMKGQVKDGTLIGNLIIKLTYDPWFTTQSLRKLMVGVQQKGIKKVQGKILLDLAVTEPMQHEEHWTPGDLKTRKLGIIFRGERRMHTEIRYALRAAGVNFVDSQLVAGRLPKDAVLLAKVSTPLHNSIFKALQNSSNEQAECIGCALAGGYHDSKGFRSIGASRLVSFVKKELGYVPETVCRVHDTSGLCVYDKVTCRLLVDLLHYSLQHRYIYNELRRDLPISGKTGTLHRRMYKPLVNGKIQAKTGTLTRENGITSLSGYVKGKNGHLLSFAIIQNDVPVADARLWQDKFCEQLVK